MADHACAIEPSNHRIGPRGRALLIGYSGGLGQALVATLDKTSVGKTLRARLDELFVLDAKPLVSARIPDGSRLLPNERIGSGEQLARILRENRIAQVVDVSQTKTMECVAACADLGVNYLSMSIEAAEERTKTRDLARLLLPGFRTEDSRGSYLIGSGMNPGIVNALALVGLRELGARAGVSPMELSLRGLYITESDSTAEISPKDEKVFAMTWSPRQCLAELLEPHSFVVREQKIVELEHAPWAVGYRARCGDEHIRGMLVPHEEVVTLASHFPSAEIGFIYEIPLAARRTLTLHADEIRDLSAWPTRKLYPPHATALVGRDRVGVLLVTKSHGELWIGFETDVRDGLRLGTNATELQVAAGALAGWNRLGEKLGIHCVEELDPTLYLQTVTEVLGPFRVVYDPSAEPLSMDERRCDIMA